jgi:hypothetical protein
MRAYYLTIYRANMGTSEMAIHASVGHDADPPYKDRELWCPLENLSTIINQLVLQLNEGADLDAIEIDEALQLP